MSFLNPFPFLSRLSYIYHEAFDTFIYTYQDTGSGPGTGREVRLVGGLRSRTLCKEIGHRDCPDSRLCGTSSPSEQRFGKVGRKRYHIRAYRTNGNSIAYRRGNPIGLHFGFRSWGQGTFGILVLNNEGSCRPSPFRKGK